MATTGFSAVKHQVMESPFARSHPTNKLGTIHTSLTPDAHLDGDTGRIVHRQRTAAERKGGLTDCRCFAVRGTCLFVVHACLWSMLMGHGGGAVCFSRHILFHSMPCHSK